MTNTPTVLITGASSGIGTAYAARFAARGHDLVLVARNTARLEALASDLRKDHDVEVEVLTADLADAADLTQVADKLAQDARIGALVNNAGSSVAGQFASQSPQDVAQMIALNVTAVARLAQVAAHRFAQSGSGAIVNIGSVIALIPELQQTAYGATKAFVLTLSQGMSIELKDSGVYVQAVLPAATSTDFWERSGADVDNLPPMMTVDVLVDAAMAGFDMKETITIPVLPDAQLWEAYQGARHAMLPHFGGVDAAPRYLSDTAAG